MDAIRVLIADDHPDVRGGLRTAIMLDPMLQVVGEASDGKQAIEQIQRLEPDIAVQRNLAVGIILLTAHEGEDLFRAAMDAGANGYLLKDNAMLEITNGIRAISSGGYYVTCSMAACLTARAAGEPTPASHADSAAPEGLLAEVAPVERRIVQMIAAQRSTRDIPNQLRLSVRTIENRRALMCEKLAIGGANALLKFALENKDRIT
jgi:DNA-binding NarL/FixJ family response regulator